MVAVERRAQARAVAQHDAGDVYSGRERKRPVCSAANWSMK